MLAKREIIRMDKISIEDVQVIRNIASEMRGEVIRLSAQIGYLTKTLEDLEEMIDRLTREKVDKDVQQKRQG